MAAKLKRDQLPNAKAENWKSNFKDEEKISFNLKKSKIVLQKETYKILAGENENRVRIYLGLEPTKNGRKYELCAYAVSAFLLGSGEVYVDYETPVYKLTKINEDFSSRTKDVVDSIKLYRSWREGKLDKSAPGAEVRKYIYPNAYLLTKYELHEIFNIQNKQEAEIDFGISKTMSAMIYTDVQKRNSTPDDVEVFDDTAPCPPFCDERSIYNS
ncbi:MAG: hypothetical protein CR996_02070 [Draconibacterium sp.]|nr:MAG: hypothetical protein CR996_02070 [Draconibacterium sp.]PIF05051.1 MAG: hypothetical protein CSA36_08640 [Draconibacterium sp.]